MEFRVFNTLGREKQTFRSLEPGRVRMYNCGPTVYNRPHVGNLRAFLFADLLRRWLEVLGYEVLQVMNITDVGHLLDDADEGEDKIEARARRENLDPRAITREITAQFLDDLRRLGVQPARVYPRATEHVPEMLEIIDALVAKGAAYVVDGNVYFDVSTFPSYGKLSGNRVEDLRAGARLEINAEKRNPEDFALWKSDPKHLMKWASRFGPDGFPGWHIECSAMARKHLGERIDIHTGGEDNVFPHHECEIAQTESLTGQPFATYWMHTKFLLVDGGKMSKSLGNTYTLDDVLARGFEPRAVRFLLLRGHYRQPLNFTWELLREAQAALENLDDLVRRARRAERRAAQAGADPAAGLASVAAAREEFDEAMNDDLNVPRALAPLFALRAEVLAGRVGAGAARELLALLERADRALGVFDFREDDLEERVEALIAERNAARAARDWRRADEIRAALLAEGIVLEDTPGGVEWRRA